MRRIRLAIIAVLLQFSAHPQAFAQALLAEPPASALRVLVIGDSLAEGLILGFGAVADRRRINVDSRAQHSTGFFQFNARIGWLEWTRQQAADRTRYDVVAVMVGINETVGLSGNPDDLRTSDYVQRAAIAASEMVANLRRRADAVVWVGLPRMRADKGDAATILLDDAVAQAVSRAGGVFVETRSLTTLNGRYSDRAWYGQDMGCRVRDGDGVHFRLERGFNAYALLADHVGRAIDAVTGRTDRSILGAAPRNVLSICRRN